MIYDFEPRLTLPFLDDDSMTICCSPELGTIRVSLWRVIIKERVPKKDGWKATLPSQGPVHEKSKKAGTHIVGYVYIMSAISNDSIVFTCAMLQNRFGPIQHIRNIQVYSTKFRQIDPADKPYVTFLFRYRPLGPSSILSRSTYSTYSLRIFAELLQANDIAPRPTPAPNTQDDIKIIKIDDSDDDDDEIRSLEVFITF